MGSKSLPEEDKTMGVAKLNIFVSDVADPCGTWNGGGRMTIFDCKGILNWPCGRYRAPDGTWQPVPNGHYENLPFRCGHLEVEVPPGCYWAVAGYASPGPKWIHLNYTTHVGIVGVRCDETACVKLYNPTVRLCWDWFWIGLRMLTLPRSEPPLDPEKVKRLEELANDLLREIPAHPIEAVIERTFDSIFEAAKAGKEE
jgi:hypothetical protein